MSNFTGRFTAIGNQSSLDDGAGRHMIFKAGIPDPALAMFAATVFLKRDRHFSSNQIITVIGEQGVVGSVSVIVMVDAHAANLPQGDAGPVVTGADASPLGGGRPTSTTDDKDTEGRQATSATAKKPGGTRAKPNKK